MPLSPLTTQPTLGLPPFDIFPTVLNGASMAGLAAAARLAELNSSFVVLEPTDGVGESVLSWRHSRSFLPWEILIDPAARRLLDSAGWEAPDPKWRPYRNEIVERYLLPLASTPEIAPNIRYHTRIVSTSQQSMTEDYSTQKIRSSLSPLLLNLDSEGTRSEILTWELLDTSI